MTDQTQLLQNEFLNALRKERVPVSVFLVNGIRLAGLIQSFDQYSIRLQGTTINNFIFESLSGLDYTQSFVRDVPPSSVPEPSSAILLLAGIMLLWSRRRQLPVISRISSEAPDAAAC